MSQQLVYDPLALLSEGQLAESQKLILPSELPPAWWDDYFRWEDYDWADPEWLEINRGHDAWLPVRLWTMPPGWTLRMRRNGLGVPSPYFMIVSPHDHRRITHHPDGSPKKWYIHLKPVEDVTGEPVVVSAYARRTGRGDEPKPSLAHREVVGCLKAGGVVDHFNGWGLDNRRGDPDNPVNIRNVSQSENAHNSVRLRTKNNGLPAGVEPRAHGLYGGKVCKRDSITGKVKTMRSKETWVNVIDAYNWYREQITAICGGEERVWAHNPTQRNFPRFPPRIDQEISERSRLLRAEYDEVPLESAEVPF